MEFKGHHCHCHRITENIFLGDIKAATDLNFLKKYNITRIVNCAAEIPNAFNYVSDEPAQGAGAIKYLNVPIDDSPDVNPAKYFGVVDKFIQDGIRRGEKILIHCAAGISRSATLLASHLMVKFKISDDEALRMLRDIRPQVNPNSGFRKVLRDYYYTLNNSWGSREKSTEILKIGLF